MIIFTLVGIWFIGYFVSQTIFHYIKLKKESLQRETLIDIEMQKVIQDVKTKIIKFEPRRPK